ncbi:unnamed protein product [Closterium sp. NIES-54]
MYALTDSAEGDCYLSVPPDPGIEAAALGASASAAPGTGESAAPGAGESALSGTTPPEALHTFTLDSGALRSFFRDSTTLTQLSRPVAVSLADPSGGPVLAHSSTVLPWTAWGNPYLVVMPDIMHQADLGIMSHTVAVVRKMKKRRVKQMDRWFPNAQVFGGHKSRQTPCHDILSDAPAAPASPTASNASNTVSVSGPPRVPEAEEDKTPSAVNKGAPEDEHQPPPKTPAADTSEHPESQPEGSQASPPTTISGHSDATPLNPLALKLLCFVRRVNGGMGMAEVDINGLLQLVVEPGIAPLVTSELRNCKDLERFEMERLAGLNRGWSVATFEIDGHPPQRLLFQNSAQVSRLGILGSEMLMWQPCGACMKLYPFSLYEIGPTNQRI